MYRKNRPRAVYGYFAVHGRNKMATFLLPKECQRKLANA